MMDAAFVIAAFVAIFAIINPISKIVFFPIITMDYTKEEKRAVISTAVLYSTIILLGFGLIGQQLFGVLGVSIPALKLTGAVVLFKVGLDMLQGQIPRTKYSKKEGDEAIEKRAVGVFPLAIPFIAGPGGIITVMLYVSSAPSVIDSLLVLVSVTVVLAITLVVLIYADKIADRIGKVGVTASMRLMGMILLAIGLQMFLSTIDMLLVEWGAIPATIF